MSKLFDVDCLNYVKVKNCLLDCFKLTPEAYRQKFHEDRRKADESVHDYIADLSTYLHRWVCVH